MFSRLWPKLVSLLAKVRFFKKVPQTVQCPSVPCASSSSAGHSKNGPPLAADLFTPRQAFVQSIIFDSLPKGGSVEANAEQWSRTGNSLRCDTRKTLAETCSGILVPIADLKARCKVTGKLTEEFERCFRCGEPVCMKHLRGLRTSDGDLLFCEDCIKVEIRNWKTKQEIDGVLQVCYPPRPFCPASKTQVSGEITHD